MNCVEKKRIQIAQIESVNIDTFSLEKLVELTG